MEQFLSKMAGRSLDVYCGGSSSVRGEVLKVEAGVLYLKDSDGKLCFVAIPKIIFVWDAFDDEHRAGFVTNPTNNR